MKHNGITQVQIPAYVDNDHMWLSFTFRGDIDTRRIRRTIRNFMKTVYGHSYRKEHFRVYRRLNKLDTVVFNGDVAGLWMQEFIKREKELLADENQDSGNPAV